MSYTAPTYVDTKEQAVLALASTIKGEAVTGGDGSVNRALDVLADVLAEQDVQVPQTDAGAILALASYVEGMVKPEGTITIEANGEGIDVAQYATADVSVSGGGAQTTDLYLWNEDASLGAHGVTVVKYQSGADYSFEGVQFEGITTEYEGTTVYGVKAKDVPAGAVVKIDTVNGTFFEAYIGYSAVTYPPSGGTASGPFAPMPIDGLYAVGSYNTDA